MVFRTLMHCVSTTSEFVSYALELAPRIETVQH